MTISLEKRRLKTSPEQAKSVREEQSASQKCCIVPKKPKGSSKAFTKHETFQTVKGVPFDLMGKISKNFLQNRKEKKQTGVSFVWYY